MRVRLVVDTGRDLEVRACTVPSPGVDYVVAEGACPEPKCRAGGHGGPPFHVSGATAQEVDDHELQAKARCRTCGAVVGVLAVDEITLFGFDEDRRVLGGPWRVY